MMSSMIPSMIDRLPRFFSATISSTLSRMASSVTSCAVAEGTEVAAGSTVTGVDVVVPERVDLRDLHLAKCQFTDCFGGRRSHYFHPATPGDSFQNDFARTLINPVH